MLQSNQIQSSPSGVHINLVLKKIYLIFRNIFDALFFSVNKILARHRLRGKKKLHLGCGSNIIDGWANIDYCRTHSSVVVLDLKKSLPIKSGSISHIYSEHFLEHLTLREGQYFLTECRRVLSPGGILRISTPNLRALIDLFLLNKFSVWQDVGWFPQSACQMVNEGMHLWGHQFIYDKTELEMSLRKAGFSNIEFCEWKRSKHSILTGLETRPFHDELIVEAY